MDNSTITTAIAADIPLLLWGPPGTGKTSALLALAREANAHVEVLIGSTLDPIDVGGQPVPDAAGLVQLSPPPWARRMRAALDANRPAWLFLDEVSCAPPSIQAALLRVVHERRVAEIDLSGCRVVAAANPADTAADGGVLSAATANRWAHVDWACDASSWTTGELSGWGTPLSSARAAAAASVCAWITRSPNALLAVPADASNSGRAWPSPRSWSAAIRLLSIAPKTARRACVASVVGDAAAAEWATHDAARDLPDPEEMLAGRATLPTRGDSRAAALVAVAAAALTVHEARQTRIERAWKILGSVRPDVAILAGRALLNGAPDSLPDEAVALGAAILRAQEKVAS